MSRMKPRACFSIGYTARETKSEDTITIVRNRTLLVSKGSSVRQHIPAWLTATPLFGAKGLLAAETKLTICSASTKQQIELASIEAVMMMAT